LRALPIVTEHLPSGEYPDFFAGGFSPGGDRSEDSSTRTGQSGHKRGSGISTWGGVGRTGRRYQPTLEPIPDCHHSAQLLSASLGMNRKRMCCKNYSGGENSPAFIPRVRLRSVHTKGHAASTPSIAATSVAATCLSCVASCAVRPICS